MASSSSHHSNNHQIQSLKNCQDKNKAEEEEQEDDDDEQEEEEEEEDDDDEDHKEWLQLKLGLESGGTSSSKLIVGHHYHQSRSSAGSVGLGLELGLGLGLGLEVWPNNNVNVDAEKPEGLLEWSRFINERVPIPSSSSCQVVNDSQSQHWFNINMPIIPPAPPSQSHHCSHTNPNVSGLWFTLHSSTNRKGEALPQIPKAYIRVKNENMTVFMVKKYLVRKLGLSNENEVDILCMGQSLLDVQSLRHVRDCIWIPTLVDSLNSSTSRDISTTNLMPLLYQIKISHF